VASTILLIVLLCAMAWWSIRLRWITAAGAAAGVAVALSVFLGAGWLGLLLLGLFFFMGSLATKWGKRSKSRQGLEQARSGQRSVPNVLANGLVPALLGIIAWWIGSPTPWAYPMLAAAIASAASDTISSELGNLYGSRYWDLRTGRAGERGMDGVVSLEGTLLGALASSTIAVPVGLAESSWRVLGIVALAGLFGNFSDSLLGASLQRRSWLNNHSVNFWSTAVAALTAYCLYAIP